jgi:hypothetical protein
MALSFLRKFRTGQGQDSRRVTGLMADRIGAQYSTAQLLAAEEYPEYLTDAQREAVTTTRAFPVTSLVGARLEADDEGDVAGQLEALLRYRCPGFDWQIERDLHGPLRKYGILHTSIAAPPDETTSQPMMVELSGSVIQLAQHDLDDENGTTWIDLRLWGKSSDERDVPISEPMTLRIDAATYANVPFPGIGVPFYM